MLLTPLVKRFSLRHGILDQPNQPRKKHARPVPLLGGVAIFLAFSLTTAVFWQLGVLQDGRILPLQIAGILLAGLVLMIGGYLDDRYNLSPSRQLLFPLVAVALALMSGIRISHVTNPFGGIAVFPAGFGIVVAGIWLLGMTYTTKFLDGLDGLTTGVTTIGAFAIFIVSLYWDVPQSGTSILALALAGACLGFLVYNWHPAKIFLGEGGSLFCGFLLGALAIISGSKIATTLLVMGVPILDGLWVILRRLWQRQSVARGDRKHLHFLLLDLGLSHRQTVALLFILTAAFGTTSFFLQTRGKIAALSLLFILTAALLLGALRLYQRKQNS